MRVYGLFENALQREKYSLNKKHKEDQISSFKCSETSIKKEQSY